MTGSWSVARLTGSAAELHARDLPDPVERAVWMLEATAPALVLGSTQPLDRRGLASRSCRRRSGGGAVLVRPGEVLWVDVLLPRGDPLWDDDVGRAATGSARRWRDAARRRGDVHTGPLVRTPWSTRVLRRASAPARCCRRRKVVGISQRRTRAGARFQCAVLRAWDSTELARIFAAGEWREVADDLDRVAVGVADLAGLEAAFLAALAAR